MAKRIAMGRRPGAPSNVESWVRQGNGSAEDGTLRRGERYAARLTLDITPALRGRIKIAAFTRGQTVAELLREVLAREFPDPGVVE